jgi:hypothetical protein
MKRLFFVLVCLVFAGCGTGYYDSLYNQHLKELELAERFGILAPKPSEISGTNLVIRLPKIFEKGYNKNSTYSLDTDSEIDPIRLNPPFLNPFPGLINCYEAFVKDPAGENLPVYLYTGIRVVSNEEKAALEQELLGKLKVVAPDANLDTVEALTPRGEKVVWKKIAIAMPQPFFPWGLGSGAGKTLPGAFELWFYDAPTGLVIFGWRAPDSVATHINLNGLATLTAGTLAIKPDEPKPVQPAAPDAAPAPADAQDPPAP